MANINLKFIEKSVITVEFNQKKGGVNTLSNEMMIELDKAIATIEKNEKIQFVIFKSAKQDNFIAGADIKEIMSITEEDEADTKIQQGQMIINRIENLKPITIALINGSCLGGGTELILGCNFRIVTNNPKVSIGLPEVNLGIFPGFGGTQRLPKLISLTNALSMIVTGKTVNSKKAYKIGLVDKIISDHNINDSLNKIIKNLSIDDNVKKLISERKKKKSKLDYIGFIRNIYYKIVTKKILAKTKNLYPAPLQAIEVIKKTYNKSIINGLKIERKYFIKLLFTDISKNLMNLFFIQQNLKKEQKYKDELIKTIDSALVLGGGTMGGGIAWLLSKNSIKVRIKDVTNDALTIAYKQIKKIYQQLISIRKITQQEVNLKMHNISHTLNDDEIDNPDIVIEAIVEDAKIKGRVLAEIESKLDEDTILATNTSSISINILANNLKHPENLVGMHFFNPVNRMPLVEVIASKHTSDYAIISTVALARRCGKVPIIVSDCPGFLVNRILIPYVNEAVRLFAEGGNIQTIDKIISDFGMPMGPFALADQIGLDVGLKVAKILNEAYGKRMDISDIFHSIVAEGDCLGKKTNKGFYCYSNKSKQSKVNQELTSLVKKKRNFSKQEIIDRCMLVMINEAAMCIDETIVQEVASIDLAMIMGTGFPPLYGGICAYADKIGIENIVNRLKHFEELYGLRFKPATLLLSMVKHDQNFYNLDM